MTRVSRENPGTGRMDLLCSIKLLHRTEMKLQQIKNKTELSENIIITVLTVIRHETMKGGNEGSRRGYRARQVFDGLRKDTSVTK